LLQILADILGRKINRFIKLVMHKIRTIIPESLELNVTPMYISYRFSNLHREKIDSPNAHIH